MAIIGPIKQIITCDNLPPCGPITDGALEIIEDGGIRFEGDTIVEVGIYSQMQDDDEEHIKIPYNAVAIPGWIDAHTHICFGGNRAADYALRISGATYQEIAARGGGILETVTKTREATLHDLEDGLEKRMQRLAELGITTCEVKSGYGLTLSDELKMLEAIRDANRDSKIDLISTCLAAHTRPPEFESSAEYLTFLTNNLLPTLIEKKITNRIDIFVEDNAFSAAEAKTYLEAAKEMGFTLSIHADQFSRGGSSLAAEVGAHTAEHLEQSLPEDAKAMKKAGVIPVVLPGATLGLGMSFPPARMLLDHDLPLVIASDWNPGSAPMGNLITQAALLSAAEKLTTAETFAAMTVRAAQALKLTDRGRIKPGQKANFNLYQTADYRDILYHQGALQPSRVYARGRCIFDS